MSGDPLARIRMPGSICEDSLAGRPAQAIEGLKPMVPYDFASTGGTMAMYPVFLRGESYLRAGEGREAAAEFQKILDHPGIVINWFLTPPISPSPKPTNAPAGAMRLICSLVIICSAACRVPCS